VRLQPLAGQRVVARIESETSSEAVQVHGREVCRAWLSPKPAGQALIDECPRLIHLPLCPCHRANIREVCRRLRSQSGVAPLRPERPRLCPLPGDDEQRAAIEEGRHSTHGLVNAPDYPRDLRLVPLPRFSVIEQERDH